MKPARLYTKIFLSFLGVLVLTELLILGLFIVSAGRTFRDRYYRYCQGNMEVGERFIYDHLIANPSLMDLPSPQFDQVLSFMAEPHGAHIWMKDTKGKLLGQSSPGPIPDVAKMKWSKFKKLEHGIIIRHGHGRGLNLYMTNTIALPNGRPVILHVLLSEEDPYEHMIGFIVGLLAVGGVVALLVIPISRIITRPVARLRASALRIAQGELAHRASPAGRDEIAELAHSFNHMADRLASMVRQGRELTAMVSHELRSPLARIRVAQQMLSDRLEEEKDPVLARYLESIRLEIEDMDQLIGRMLELSKLDLSSEPPVLKPLAIAELLEGIMDRFRPVMEQKGLTLRALLDKNLMVATNPEAMASALANLMENAVKYTDPGGWVEVSLTRAGDNAMIQVANQAPPLAESEMESIFQPFARGDQVKAGGYGLGLAISRGIVKRHGGSLTASNRESGPVFTVTLPAMATDRASSAPAGERT